MPLNYCRCYLMFKLAKTLWLQKMKKIMHINLIVFRSICFNMLLSGVILYGGKKKSEFINKFFGKAQKTNFK